MTTGLTKLDPPNKFILGDDDLKTRVLTYLETASRRHLSAIWDSPGLLFDEVSITQGTTGTPAVPDLDVASGDYKFISGDGGETNESSMGSFAHDDTGFENVPFLPTGTVNVYLRNELYPDAIRGGIDGKYSLTGWKWGIGERRAPDAVAVAGNDVVMTVDAAVGTIWATSDAPRTVTAWIKVPGVGVQTAVGIQTASAVSDGSNVKVTFPNTKFGQSTVSTTASDYEVFVPGLFLTTSTAEKTDTKYAWIGSVTSGTFTNAGAVVHNIESLQDLKQGLLDQPNRPGLAFPSLDDMEAWNDASNVTIATPGAPNYVTVTIDDPSDHTGAADNWAIATNNRIGIKFKSGGLAAAQGTNTSGDYVAFVDTEDVGAGGVELYLRISTEADWLSTHDLKLPIQRYTLNGSAVSAKESSNLPQLRGILHPTTIGGGSHDLDGAVLSDVMLYPAKTGSGVDAYFNDVQPKVILHPTTDGGTPGRPVLETYAFLDNVTPAATLQAAAKRERYEETANMSRITRYGPNGSAAVLANDEVVSLVLGKLGIEVFAEKEAGNTHEMLGIGINGGDDLMILAEGSGSPSEHIPTATPTIWSLQAPDFVLMNTDQGGGVYSGKLVTRGCPILTNGLAFPSVKDVWGVNWVHTKPVWEVHVGGSDDCDGSRLWIGIPSAFHPGTTPAGEVGGSSGAFSGRIAKLVKVTANVGITGSANAGDGVDAKIISLVSSTATESAKSAVVTFRSGSDGRKDIDVTSAADAKDSGPVGQKMETNESWYLELEAVEDGTPLATVVRRLHAVTFTYRVFELGAGG